MSYPENGIFSTKSFVFCWKILYSHSELQHSRVAFEVLLQGHGKGVVRSSLPEDWLRRKERFEGSQDPVCQRAVVHLNGGSGVLRHGQLPATEHVPAA